METFVKKAPIIVGTNYKLGYFENPSNILNKPKVQKNITMTADSSDKPGSI